MALHLHGPDNSPRVGKFLLLSSLERKTTWRARRAKVKSDKILQKCHANCRTQIPVCSLAYKKTLQDINKKRSQIEEAHDKIKMKKDVLEKQRSTLGISTCMINTAHQNIGNEDECSKSQ
ncbi:Hypothetical predicted protein [Paramuricea clavata]|uniref:Uncharacterized protein n=1 Tax=Paramuricea clavata TaxID=317549 RepID=A0A7D9E309_PARCT|nr:Hypothetical predicted protein [Paramuricea clavata]